MMWLLLVLLVLLVLLLSFLRLYLRRRRRCALRALLPLGEEHGAEEERLADTAASVYRCTWSKE
jgi:hypothetical protein